jgi:hypothetical protein
MKNFKNDPKGQPFKMYTRQGCLNNRVTVAAGPRGQPTPPADFLGGKQQSPTLTEKTDTSTFQVVNKKETRTAVTSTVCCGLEVECPPKAHVLKVWSPKGHNSETL